VLEGIINEEEQNFAATVKTKISVDKLVSQIEGGAEFSFDYMMLVVVASLLAGVGLATDNTVRAAASVQRCLSITRVTSWDCGDRL